VRAEGAITDQRGLELSTKLSALALSSASPTLPIEASTLWSSNSC
jgi:hypothetical protein